MRRVLRRRVLQVTAAGAAALAGCTGDTGTGSGGSNGADTDGDGTDPPTFDGFMSDAGNYDRIVDRTDADRVTVEVGVANEADRALAFGPAGVRLTTGTTVVWEWTGKGGSHNVVDTDGAFESGYAVEASHTFTHEFTTTGEFTYYCTPHRAAGMKGVVVVE